MLFRGTQECQVQAQAHCIIVVKALQDVLRCSLWNAAARGAQDCREACQALVCRGALIHKQLKQLFICVLGLLELRCQPSISTLVISISSTKAGGTACFCEERWLQGTAYTIWQMAIKVGSAQGS